jgi:hypothetical protein
MAFVYGTPLHRAAMATDERWSAELAKAFGKQAGDVRYTVRGRGGEGTELRAAYDAHVEAQMAWADECKRATS